MSSKSRKILVAQVKLDLTKVIENLKLLENPDKLEPKILHDVKVSTQKVLKALENQPLERLKRKIQCQRKKRQRKKLLSFKKPSRVTCSHEFRKPEPHHIATENLTQQTSESIDHQKRSKKHNQHYLRSLQECHSFLKRFELLEQLHLARGHDPFETRKFSSKLQHFKTVWNCLLKEKQGEFANDEQQIEQQWNDVLFGVSEKSYLKEMPNMKYFLRKRHIWDSFIDNLRGTSIPIGWVLPPTNPNNEWSQYLVKE